MPEKRERRTRGADRPILPRYLQGTNPKPLIEVFEEKLFEKTSTDEDGNLLHETLYGSINNKTGKVTFRATAETEETIYDQD